MTSLAFHLSLSPLFLSFSLLFPVSLHFPLFLFCHFHPSLSLSPLFQLSLCFSLCLSDFPSFSLSTFPSFTLDFLIFSHFYLPLSLDTFPFWVSLSLSSHHHSLSAVSSSFSSAIYDHVSILLSLSPTFQSAYLSQLFLLLLFSFLSLNFSLCICLAHLTLCHPPFPLPLSLSPPFQPSLSLYQENCSKIIVWK